MTYDHLLRTYFWRFGTNMSPPEGDFLAKSCKLAQDAATCYKVRQSKPKQSKNELVSTYFHLEQTQKNGTTDSKVLQISSTLLSYGTGS